MTILDISPLGIANRSAPTTIRLSGEIDIYTSPMLRERLMEVLESSTRLLVLDLSRVAFCDATGLSVLVGVRRRAQSMGITVALASPRPGMTKLLRITGLDRSFPILGDQHG
jgi:anti-anti-sigma factor